jgi:hypothetical protein
VRNEASQSEEDDKESHVKEEVGAWFPFSLVLFFA